MPHKLQAVMGALQIRMPFKLALKPTWKSLSMSYMGVSAGSLRIGVQRAACMEVNGLSSSM